MNEPDPLSRQVGGDHYKGMSIQPMEFNISNRLTYAEGCVVKYVCRHRSKGGRQDLEKAVHYLEALIAAEYPEDKEQG